MTPLDILKGARALIEKPEHWCAEPERLSDGVWCAALAMSHASRLPRTGQLGAGEWESTVGTARMEARWLFARVVGIRRPGEDCPVSAVEIGYWNDASTHAEVLSAFDRAIELAGGDA